MIVVAQVARFLSEFAPPSLAESWDNVGLLVGSHARQVERVMTCLTITPDSLAEAIARRADLIVTHHPLPFRALKRLTDETSEGRLLLDLIAAKISVFSPHTAFDSAAQGINQRLAAGLELEQIQPLLPAATGDQGAGRQGHLPKPLTLGALAERVKQWLGIERVQAVGRLDQPIRQVAVACGSAGEFLDPARAAGCGALVTGEVRFHTCLEAEAWQVGLVLAGHFASERFGVEALVGEILEKFPTLQVWASQQEKDPLHWL